VLLMAGVCIVRALEGQYCYCGVVVVVVCLQV
jgi:hypothetical protein